MENEDRNQLLIDKRIDLLGKFYDVLQKWYRPGRNEPNLREWKSYLNRNLIAVRNAVRDAGTLKLITVGPPPAIGGMIVKGIDPFENLFESFYGSSLVPSALDCIEQALGVYEHMQSDSGLVTLRPREVIDLETAIERALRPSFRRSPPESEREVQDAVETILNAVGVTFSREKEVAPVGNRGFIPDFTVPDMDLALEVKFAKQGHGISKIQEEIAADIAAYRTKWRHLLFVIYDLGVIDDPYALRKENLRLFGIPVVVVKH